MIIFICKSIYLFKNLYRSYIISYNISIFNLNMLFKKKDSKVNANMISHMHYLKYLNMLNCSISEVGLNLLNNFSSLNAKDFYNFSSLYFLNVSNHNLENLDKIIEFKLLCYSFKLAKKLKKNSLPLLLNQNSVATSNFYVITYATFGNVFKYFHLPTSTFYQTNETFMNSEGLIKRVTAIINSNKTKTN